MMKLFSRFAEPAERLPHHDDVVGARAFEVRGCNRGNRGMLFGVGLVLVDVSGNWSPAYNVGDQMPVNLDEAIVRVLGVFGPAQVQKRKSAERYKSTSANIILPEDELLLTLINVPEIVREEYALVLKHPIGVRQSETFTPINFQSDMQVVTSSLGEYDVD